jgi:hypothetical protein
VKRPEWDFVAQLGRISPPDVVLLLAVEELAEAFRHEAWRARLDDMSTRAAIFDEAGDVIEALFTEFREAQDTFYRHELDKAEAEMEDAVAGSLEDAIDGVD